MAKPNTLSLVVEAMDKASGPLSKIGQSVTELGKKSNTTGKRLKSLAGTAAKVTLALAAVGVAAKKALDLAAEGAAVRQTGESFGFLLEKVGATPKLLAELRKASRGTISDMDLMSSTSTLLAGAQGELAQELAASTPQLLEIAKAAQKLNPALGDTTFLYDSLALGVKRASPMILDNLGLTIRIGEANEAYAKQLGKAVGELTAAEMKQALLNETLRAGSVLIEQAGGSTESATDAYTRLDSSVKNMTDTWKGMLHEAVAPSVSGLADFVSGISDSVLAQQALKDALKAGTITQKTYNDLVEKAKETEYTYAEALAHVETVTNATTAAMQHKTAVLVEATAATTAATDEEIAAIYQQGEYARTVGELARQVLLKADAAKEAAAETSIYGDALADARDEARRATPRFRETGAEIDVMGDHAYDAARQVDDMTLSLIDNQIEMGTTTAKSLALREAERLYEIGTYDAKRAADALLISMGLMSQEAIDVSRDYQFLVDNVGAFGITLDEVQAGAITLIGKLGEFEDSAQGVGKAFTSAGGALQGYRGQVGATITANNNLVSSWDGLASWGGVTGSTAPAAAAAAKASTTAPVSTSKGPVSSPLGRNLLTGSWEGPGLMPGQTSPDVERGDSGQWGVEYGDQSGGWNEGFGEWQPGAGGRSEAEHAKDVLEDIRSRHASHLDESSFMQQVADGTLGWVNDFMQSGGGPGSGTGLIGRGFSKAAIQAAATGQHGLSMTVPPGFNRDNFMVGVSSGERVEVTPSHMLGGGKGGGMTVNTINVYGVQTGSQLYEEVVKAARSRGRAFARVV